MKCILAVLSLSGLVSIAIWFLRNYGVVDWDWYWVFVPVLVAGGLISSVLVFAMAWIFFYESDEDIYE